MNDAINDLKATKLAPYIRHFDGNKIFVDLNEANATAEDLAELKAVCQDHFGEIIPFLTYVRRIGTHGKREYSGRPVFQQVFLTLDATGHKWVDGAKKGPTTAKGRMGSYILESLDKPHAMQWDQQDENGWIGSFEVDNVEYTIACLRNDVMFEEPVFELALMPSDDPFRGHPTLGNNDELEITNPIRVFSTALAAFREFLTAIKPDRIQVTTMDSPAWNRILTSLDSRFGPDLARLGYEKIPSQPNRLGTIASISYGPMVALSYERKSSANS